MAAIVAPMGRSYRLVMPAKAGIQCRGARPGFPRPRE